MEKYNLIIVGAGPAGIFTAVELLRRGSKKHILLVEKGKPVEKRHCPKAEIGHCVNCRPTCAITTGFSGAGAFSDGKLSLSYEVGGDPASSAKNLHRSSSTTPTRSTSSSALTPMWRASTPARTSRRSARTPSTPV
jgi:uncharacterized FAD-dependent dehydrogenase